MIPTRIVIGYEVPTDGAVIDAIRRAIHQFFQTFGVEVQTITMQPRLSAKIAVELGIDQQLQDGDAKKEATEFMGRPVTVTEHIPGDLFLGWSRPIIRPDPDPESDA